MSDSEDEGAFASADEGEEVGKHKKGQAKVQPPSSKENPKMEAEGKSKTDTGATAKGGASKTVTSKAVSYKPDAKKGKGKQQKRKGEGNGQQQKQQQKEKQKAYKPDTPAESTSAKEPPTKEENPTSSSPEKNLSADGIEETAKDSSEKSKTSTASEVVRKADSIETGSGDAKEIDVSKKAGDVRKGIPSDAASPKSQNISREEPTQSTGNTSSGKENTQADTGGGWGWSSWGSSIMSAASTSVQTFKSQVGDGFNTIMDTVESSLGAVDPEDMAREEAARKAEAKKASSGTVTSQPEDQVQEDTTIVGEKPEKGKEGKEKPSEKENAEKEAKKEESQKETGPDAKKEKDSGAGSDGAGGWFASWGVADIAKKVQDTGKTIASKGHTLMADGFDAVENLASGGIDVLETIGKKTYTTLSEHDPAFKKTREYLKTRTDKPNLSGVLREAKDQAEREAAATEENEEARKAHFGTQFDEFQGIAHLEALEILSNQSEKKVHSLLNSLSSSDLKVIKPILISIKEAFEMDDEDGADDQKEQDFSGLVSRHVSELELGTAPDKLNKVHAMVKQWMVDFETQESHEGETVKSIHQRAIQSLAELTSKGVEQFHKAGELVLMQRDADKDCKERAHSFARLTGVLCHEIGNLATKFSDCLNKISAQQEDADDVKTVVTNIYLEATNSSTYIQDAFQLLLPVLQQAAIEHNILSRES